MAVTGSGWLVTSNFQLIDLDESPTPPTGNKSRRSWARSAWTLTASALPLER
jgi:hypothetical protein